MRYLTLLLPLALVACATTGAGSGIAIETISGGQTLPGADCTVSTGAGSWNIKTPASLDVGRANGDLRVVCNKSGYRTSELIFRPSNPVGSNVGLGVGGGGGNVGVGVGMNFPIRVGAGSYPSQVTVEMNRQ